MAISIPVISSFDSKGIDKALRAFDKLETTGQKAMFAIGKAAAPAGVALGALATFGGDALKAFAEDDAAAQKLATTLENVTGATDSQVASVEDFISKTSVAAAITDDELRPAFDKLVRGTGDVTKAQDLMTLALDVAAGTGKDLGAVSDALSKAFNGQLGPLKKLNPALAGLIEDGASADEVFAALGNTFGGQASKQANTAQGKMKSLSIQMGEFKESVGAAIAPLLEKLLPALQKLGDWVSSHVSLIVTLGVVIGGIAAAIWLVNAAQVAWTAATSAFTVVQAAFNAVMALNPIFLMVAAIVAIIAILVVLQAKFDIFGKLFDAIGKGVSFVFSYIGTVFGKIGDVLQKPFSWFLSYLDFWKGIVLGVFGGLKDLAGSIFDNVGGAFKGVINAVISALEKGLNFAIKGLNIILDGIDKAAGPWVNFGSIPNVSLPRLAEGGIVNSPTIAMIGEAGPEAVVPLNKAGGFGATNVTINVSGGDPNAVVAALRSYMQRNGSIPIRVSN